MNVHKDTTNAILKVKEALDYYDLLKETPLDGVRAIGCSSFPTFISRLECVSPLNWANWRVKVGTDNHVKKYAESWQKKKEILEGATGIPFPMAVGLILTCFYPFLTGTFKDGKKAFTLSSILKSYLHELLPMAESECMYRQIHLPQGSQPQELPAGKRVDIIRKIVAPYHEKLVIIDFWATTCGPYRVSIEHHADLRKEYRNNPNIKFILITGDSESPEKVYNDYIKKNLKEKVILRLPQSDYSYLRELSHSSGTPRYVLLDRGEKLLDGDSPMYNIEQFPKKSRIEKE